MTQKIKTYQLDIDDDLILNSDPTIALGAATKDYVDTNGGVNTGGVLSIATITIPTGYLECDGSTISRTSYADLFGIIGTSFGIGDGSTTFALPDLRGEFIRGWDNSRGIDSGRTLGSWQIDEFKSHNHGNGAVTVAGYGYVTGGSYRAPSNTGFSGGAETRPRNIALMYIIKY